MAGLGKKLEGTVRVVCASIILLASVALITGCNRCRDGCQNGTCVQRECQCDLWWEGDACDRPLLDTWAGEYMLVDDCDTASARRVRLRSDESAPSEMMLDGDTRLIFTDQSRFLLNQVKWPGGNNDAVIGQGEMLIDRFSFWYRRLDDPDSTECHVEATRM